MSLTKGSKVAEWIALQPDLGESKSAHDQLLRYVRSLRRWQGSEENSDELLQRRSEFVRRQTSQGLRAFLRLRAVALVLTDLVEQGWGIRIRSGQVEVLPSDPMSLSAFDARQLVRRQELIKRDDQLMSEPVQRFVRSLERPRSFNGHMVSIFSLMRDGAELSKSLERVNNSALETDTHALSEIIDPYVEFVGKRDRCRHTGIRLMDVWRYFRHTWTNQYTSIPGRSMAFLVRDAAAPFHPIIGIAALSSPVVQLEPRDRWIGWHPDAVLDELRDRPTATAAKWLVEVVDKGVGEIYTADFVKEGLISRYGLRRPSEDAISELFVEAERQRRAHKQHGDRNLYAELNGARRAPTTVWRSKARTHLFRSKRASALAELLRARMTFNECFGDSPTGPKLRELLRRKAGQDAVCTVVKRAKAERIGTAMADITVCGALPPYNAILGGKLVTMLATSPEVLREYNRRYRGAESEIASGMAGRPISRPAHLVYLGTTSLYGAHSSQYNRVRIPCEFVGGKQGSEIKLRRLGRSESFGTSHYRGDTIRALVSVLEQSNGGRRVTSIFGEGGSPKLRKIRQSLDLLGLPSRELLKHGRRRIIYGVALVSNLREYLMGHHKRPRYLLPISARGSTRQICEWWMTRWLAHRVRSERVLDAMAEHTLRDPDCHGARVNMVVGDNGRTAA